MNIINIRADLNSIFRQYLTDIMQNQIYDLNLLSAPSHREITIYDNNTTLVYYTSKTKNYTKISEDISKFDFYHTQKEKISNSKNCTNIFISDELKTIFYNKLLDKIPSTHLDEFISVSGQLLSISERLKALINNKEVFKKTFTVKKKNFISIPSNQEFSNTLKLLNNVIKDPKEQIDILYKYCENSPLLIKRIEIQNLLKNFINYNYSKNEEFENINKQFSIFYNIENTNDINPFNTCFPIYFYEIDRNKIFTKYYHSQLTDKYLINLFMEQISQFFNSDKILKKYNLSKLFFVNCDGGGRTAYNFIFQTNQTEQLYNYQTLLIELFEKGIPHINSKFSNSENWFNLFNTILNHYLLNKKLNTKEKSTKINKI